MKFSLHELEKIKSGELSQLVYFESDEDEDGQFTRYDVVIDVDGKFYRYNGKIHQDAYGFEQVTFVRVRPVQKTVTVWERVEGDGE